MNFLCFSVRPETSWSKLPQGCTGVSVAVGLQQLFCASLARKLRNPTLIWTHRNLGRSFVGALSLRMQFSRFSLHSKKELEENFFHLWLPVGFRQNPVERLSRTGPLQPSSIARSAQGASSSLSGNPGTLSCWCCPRCCSNKAQTSHPGRCCTGRFVASGCHAVSAGLADRLRPTKQMQVQLSRCGENRTGHASIDLPSGVWSQWGCSFPPRCHWLSSLEHWSALSAVVKWKGKTLKNYWMSN